MTSSILKMPYKIYSRDFHDFHEVPKEGFGGRRNLNKRQNKFISSKKKQEKNNSSSNIIGDICNRKVNKVKIIKKGGKIRCPYFRPSVDKTPFLLTSKDMFNNSFVNGPYRQRIKIPDFLLNMEDSASVSVDTPKFANYRTKSKKDLQKRLSKSITSKKVEKKRKSCKYLQNDSSSQISLSSSISAHNQVVFDSKEETMNKYFAKFFNEVSRKKTTSNNWNISNRNLDCEVATCDQTISHTKEKSNKLLDDIYELVKVFVKDNPTSPVNCQPAKTFETNSMKDNIDPKLQINLIPNTCIKVSLSNSASQSTVTLLAVSCFNSLPNSFFEHVYMPLNQVAITTISVPTVFNKSLVNFIKCDLYFSQLLEQISHMPNKQYYSSVEYVKKRLRPFNRIHSEFFTDEAVKVFSAHIHKPISHHSFYSSQKKFYSDIFELDPDNDDVFSHCYNFTRL